MKTFIETLAPSCGCALLLMETANYILCSVKKEKHTGDDEERVGLDPGMTRALT